VAATQGAQNGFGKADYVYVNHQNPAQAYGEIVYNGVRYQPVPPTTPIQTTTNTLFLIRVENIPTPRSSNTGKGMVWTPQTPTSMAAGEKGKSYSWMQNNAKEPPSKTAQSVSTNPFQMQCSKCQETATPQWRRGPLGANTLCNACGLTYARRQKKRASEEEEKKKAEQKENQETDRRSSLSFILNKETA
jgi:hypothetical protein